MAAAGASSGASSGTSSRTYAIALLGRQLKGEHETDHAFEQRTSCGFGAGPAWSTDPGMHGSFRRGWALVHTLKPMAERPGSPNDIDFSPR